MADQLLADEPCIRWRNGFIYFVLVHPIDAHRGPRCGNRTIAAASDLNKILPFVRLAKMRLTPIKGVHFRMFAVCGRDYQKIRLEEPVPEYA